MHKKFRADYFYFALAFIGISLRIFVAFNYPLDIDETFYLDIASTTKNGEGVFPSTWGYPNIPIMGGLGYINVFNAAFILFFGAEYQALRAGNFIIYILGSLALASGLRRLFNEKLNFWLTFGLIYFFSFSTVSVTGRMDSWIFFYHGLSLALASITLKSAKKNYHLFLGFWFGLSVQFHIHAIIIVIGLSILYLYLPRKTLHQVLGFFILGGFLSGILYLIFNIALDTKAFLSVIGNYQGSFYNGNPVLIVFRKKMEFWQTLYRDYPFELGLWLFSFLAYVSNIKKKQDTKILAIFLVSTLVFFYLLPYAHPHYYSHFFPLWYLFIPIGIHFWLHWQKKLTIFVVMLFCFLNGWEIYSRNYMSNYLNPNIQVSRDEIQYLAPLLPNEASIVSSSFMLDIFIDYPHFLTYDGGHNFSMRYLNIIDTYTYWQLKAPDIVVFPNTIPDIEGQLTKYLENEIYLFLYFPSFKMAILDQFTLGETWRESDQTAYTEHPAPYAGRIFDPSRTWVTDDWMLEAAGLYLAWWRDVTPDGRADLFDLLRTAQMADPDLDSPAIQAWRADKKPEHLRQAGVDYLFVSSEWRRFLSEEEKAQIDDPQHYPLVRTWTHPALNVRFWLYAVTP